MPRTFTIAQVRNVQIKFSANSFYKLNLSPSWPKKKANPSYPWVHVTLCFGCLSQASLWVLHLRSSFLSFQGDDSQCVSRVIRGARIADFILSANQIFRLPTIRKNVRGGGIVFVEKRRRIFAEAVQLQKKNLRRWDLGKFWGLQCVCYWRLYPGRIGKKKSWCNPKNSCKSPNAFQLVISFPVFFGPFCGLPWRIGSALDLIMHIWNRHPGLQRASHRLWCDVLGRGIEREQDSGMSWKLWKSHDYHHTGIRHKGIKV